MKEKRIVKDEAPKEIQSTEVKLEREEENLGVEYEIVIGSTNG